MNQSLARKLASEGFSLYESEKYDEANEKYEQAVGMVDPSHWFTQEIYGEYAVVLKKIGRKADALKALEFALESALLSEPDSNGVTVARHFLAEYLIELGNPEFALKGLLPVLHLNVELKWLISFSAAHAYYCLGDVKNCELQSHEVVKTAPNGKFNDVKSVRAQFQNYARRIS